MQDTDTFTIHRILIGIAIFIVGLIAIKVVLTILRKILKKSTVDESIYAFVINSIKISIFIILILYMLSYYGISMTPIITVLGVGTAAIALALKDSLGNIAGGVLILISKPFIKYDLIEVQNVMGRVEKINLFNTTLKTLDNKVVIIPNGQVTTAVLLNCSKEEDRRIDLNFSVGYDADLNKVKTVLHQVAEDCPYAIRLNETIVGVTEYNDHSIVFDFKVWCKTSFYWDAIYYLQETVKVKFDEAGINIPFNRLDVHLKEK